MHWIDPDRGVLLCLDPRLTVTVVIAAAGLDPVFVPRPDGSLFATVPEPVTRPPGGPSRDARRPTPGGPP